MRKKIHILFIFIIILIINFKWLNEQPVMSAYMKKKLAPLIEEEN